MALGDYLYKVDDKIKKNLFKNIEIYENMIRIKEGVEGRENQAKTTVQLFDDHDEAY